MAKKQINKQGHDTLKHKLSILKNDAIKLRKSVDALIDTIDSMSGSFASPSDGIDLGLPSGRIWCSHNVGAEKPEDYGLLFSWGNTDGHGDDGYDFSWESYEKTPGYKLKGNIIPGSENDAASVNMGGGWRMPAKADMVELYEYTDWVWTSLNGVKGMKFMKKDDHSVYIFLPASCYDKESTRYYSCSGGYYWSSARYSERSARNLSFFSSGVYPQDYIRRCGGHAVRAVQ